MAGARATHAVIGDNKGGHSSSLLATEPWLLERLRSTLTVQPRIIHQARNPFDNISTMNRQAPKPLRDTVADYFTLCESVRSTRDSLSREALIDIHHEDLIDNPHRVLADLCRFLEVEPDPSYLDACASVVYDSPHKSRHGIEWPRTLIDEVDSRLQDFDFLLGYHYE